MPRSATPQRSPREPGGRRRTRRAGGGVLVDLGGGAQHQQQRRDAGRLTRRRPWRTSGARRRRALVGAVRGRGRRSEGAHAQLTDDAARVALRSWRWRRSGDGTLTSLGRGEESPCGGEGPRAGPGRGAGGARSAAAAAIACSSDRRMRRGGPCGVDESFAAGRRWTMPMPLWSARARLRQRDAARRGQADRCGNGVALGGWNTRGGNGGRGTLGRALRGTPRRGPTSGADPSRCTCRTGRHRHDSSSSRSRAARTGWTLPLAGSSSREGR